MLKKRKNLKEGIFLKPIRLLSLFSGIGVFEKCSRLNIPFEVVNYCEIDRYPAKAYSILHNIPEEKNLWDVKDRLGILAGFRPLTWGFPALKRRSRHDGQRLQTH